MSSSINMSGIGILILLFVVTGLVIAVNHVLREQKLHGILRALATVGLIIFAPLVLIFGSYMFLERGPRLVHLDSPASVPIPDATPQGGSHVEAPNSSRLQSQNLHTNVRHESFGLQGQLNLSVMIVFALAFVGLLIGFQVWLQQSGAALSGKSVLLAALSLIWLLPVAFVLLWVSYRAVWSSVAIYKDFNDPMPTTAGMESSTESKSFAGHTVADAHQMVGYKPVTPSPASTTPTTSPIPVPAVTPPADAKAAPADSASSEPKVTESKVEQAPGTEPKPETNREPVPDWIARGKFEENGSRFYIATSQQFATEIEARDQALANAVKIVEADIQKNYPGISWAMLTPEIVQRFAVRRQYIETERRTTSAGTPFEVQRAHYQVEISPGVYTEMRKSAQAEWASSAVATRLKGLGAVGGFLTAMFATLAGYLRLDDRTKGSYRGRLRVAAVSLIVAAGVAAAAVI